MDASPFSKLPAELRDEIYELVLCTDGRIVLDVTNRAPRVLPHPRHWARDGRTDYKNTLALTVTCKDVRLESHPLFFSKNKFPIATEEISSADQLHERRQDELHLSEWVVQLGCRAQDLAFVDLHFGAWIPGNDSFDAEEFVEIIDAYRAVLVERRARVSVTLAGYTGYHVRDKREVLICLPLFDLTGARQTAEEPFGGLLISITEDSDGQDAGMFMDRVGRKESQYRGILLKLVKLLEAAPVED